MGKAVKQPSKSDEALLNSIMENIPENVCIKGTNKKYSVGWMRYETRRKLSDLIIRGENDLQLVCKSASLIILNDFWKIRFFHWILWRWFYYFRQYTEDQLMPILIAGKKKVPQEAFLTATMLLIGTRDTMMTMTKQEVEHFLQEQRGGAHSA